MQQRVQRTTQESDRIEQQIAHAQQQQKALGSVQSERNEWFEQVLISLFHTCHRYFDLLHQGLANHFHLMLVRQ